MNDRSGLLTLAAYITATMLIALVAFLGIFRFGVQGRVDAMRPSTPDAQPQLATTDARTSRFPSDYLDSPNVDPRRVQILQAMLSEKSDLLRRQAQQISRQSGDLADLRRDYENAMLLIETIDPESLPESTESDRAQAGGTDLDQPEEPEPDEVNESGESTEKRPLTPQQVKDLQAELVLAHAVHDALIGDLDAMQTELEAADVRIAQLQEDANVKSTNDLRDALALEAAAANILIRIGADSVPMLIDALEHDNPIVRRWAASVLGSLGSVAGDAAPALTAALTDGNNDVQLAARAALEAIER